MQVHHRVTPPPSISLGLLKVSPIPVYSPEWREAMWSKCLDLGYKNTMQRTSLIAPSLRPFDFDYALVIKKTVFSFFQTGHTAQ